MARLSDILKGKRARRTVEFPLTEDQKRAIAEEAAAAGQPAPGPVLVDLVVLNGDEEAKAIELARAAAITAGVADPKLGEPLYDLALMVFTLLYGAIDHSEPERRVQFFESAEQIRTELDRDRISYLYKHHELWQDVCSPEPKGIEDATFYSFIVEAAGAEDPSIPFSKLRPATAAIYLQLMAKLLLNLQALKSSPSSTSEADIETSTRSESDDIH